MTHEELLIVLMLQLPVELPTMRFRIQAPQSVQTQG